MRQDRYTGKTFGRLTVKHFSHKKNSLYYYHCVCSCGNTKTSSTSSLLAGYAKSCGCISEENKVGNKRLCRVYSSMMTRCHNEKHPTYKFYGAKGIAVCDEWRNNSKSFYEWALNNGYDNGLDIDREKNHLGYSPQNCRFITHDKNMKNRSNSVFVEYEGRTLPLSDIAKRFGINLPRLYDAVKVRGKPVQQVIAEYLNTAT